MTTVYLAAAGGILGSFVSGMPMGFMSIMGIISLAGIVVRNGIVLIEFFRLIFSTILTLSVVPTLYMVVASLKLKRKHKKEMHANSGSSLSL